ncbi:hypothetical protein P171DRAFT_436490 [Karstenula rhodostoma CBS 690.94]|uniref:Uncharacterized protein n=1 Tax=Karstenula rhodostoma CBS 690.94 TaxID=1392251 RepID=A0A9P4P8G3_9PLEO|nr:hypothetical protein P171DRAFT_436490 [Karstenula rhodostoma CBS 690.94]
MPALLASQVSSSPSHPPNSAISPTDDDNEDNDDNDDGGGGGRRSAARTLTPFTTAAERANIPTRAVAKASDCLESTGPASHTPESLYSQPTHKTNSTLWAIPNRNELSSASRSNTGLKNTQSTRVSSRDLATSFKMITIPI